MAINLLLNQLGLDTGTVQYFEPFLILAQGKFSFKTLGGQSFGIGFAGDQAGVLVRHIYIGYDAKEAMCFGHFNTHLLKKKTKMPFVQSGLVRFCSK